MSEADTVHKGAGSILITVRGEVMENPTGSERMARYQMELI
jgi:hypothetical protein